MKRLINLCFGLSLLSGATAMAQETPTMVSTEPQNRKILIEEYTGIGCQFCPLGHVAANGVAAAYPEQTFVINIHQGTFADGQDPDLTTEWGTALFQQIGANGYPAGSVNRHLFPGNQVLSVPYDSWGTEAAKLLDSSSYANVGAKATVDWDQRKIMVEVEVYYTAKPKNATSNFINVALLQDNILGKQQRMDRNPAQIVNGLYNHMHALRDLLTGQWGEEIKDLEAGKLIKKTYVKTLPESIKSVDLKLEDLSVVVFVTESHTEVMNVCKAQMTHTGNAPAHIVRLSAVEALPATPCTPVGRVLLSLNHVLSVDSIRNFTLEATTTAGTQTFDYEPADFAAGKTETVEVGPFPLVWNLRDSLKLRLTKINGEAYTWDKENTIVAPIVIWGNDVLNSSLPLTLDIMQDRFGSEISWQLTKDSEVIAKMTRPYRDLDKAGTRLNTETLPSLSAGCYTLTVKDSSGDGINSDFGEGYIELKDASGAVVSHMDGKYDSSVQIFFRVTGVANEKSLTAAYALSVNPNPVAAADAELSFTTAKAEELTVAIYSLSGVRMGEALRCQAEGGQQRLPLPTANLRPGLYMVVVSGEDGRRAACKLVVR